MLHLVLCAESEVDKLNLTHVDLPVGMALIVILDSLGPVYWAPRRGSLCTLLVVFSVLLFVGHVQVLSVVYAYYVQRTLLSALFLSIDFLL